VWPTVDGKPPLDTPLCGFFGDLCPPIDEGTPLKIPNTPPRKKYNNKRKNEIVTT